MVHHLITGRMNPMHIGHELGVNNVITAAKKEKGTHSIFLTRSQDPQKNPLSHEEKLKHAKRAFPDTRIDMATPQTPSLVHHAAELHSRGVRHLVLHVGSDRVEQFKNLLNRYNGKEGKHGYYNFKKIEVRPVGSARSEKGSQVASASATKARKFAARGDLTSFKKIAPSRMSDRHKTELYHDVRKGMKVSEGISSFRFYIKEKSQIL